MITTLKFRVKGFIALLLFLSPFVIVPLAGVSFFAIVRITFGV